MPPTSAATTWTWTDWADGLQKLTRRQGETVSQIGLGNVGSFVSYPQLWQTDWIASDLKTVVCDSAEMVECYSRYFDLANRQRVLPRPGRAGRLVRDEHAAGGLQHRQVRVDDDGAGGGAPVRPAQGGRPRARARPAGQGLGAGRQLAQLRSDQRREAAGRLLGPVRWLANEARWSRFAGKIPAQAQLQLPYLQELFKEFKAPRLEAVISALATAVPQTRLFQLTTYPQVSAAINEAFNRDLWTGQVEVGTVLKSLKPALQGIIGT